MRHAGFIPMDRLDAAVEQHFTAHLHDFFHRRLPHLARTEAGIKEIADERLGGRRRLFALEGVEDGVAQGKALDPLRGPVGADFIAGDAPDLFGVGFEKHLEKALAETVGHPLGKRQLGLDRVQAGLGVTENALESGHRPQLHKAVHGLQRITEELPPVINARKPRAIDEIVGHDLPPDFVDFRRLAEEAVTADVEPEPTRLHRARDSADVNRVGLPHHYILTGTDQLPRGCQACGAPAHDHNWFRHKLNKLVSLPSSRTVVKLNCARSCNSQKKWVRQINPPAKYIPERLRC